MKKTGLKRVRERGAASIPFVLGMGVLVLLIAISITSVELMRVYLAQANIHGIQAREYAEVGLRDALMKIARDSTYSIPDPNFYPINLSSDGCTSLTACARVSVSSSTATTSDPKIIKSIGYYKAARIGLIAEILYDPASRGKINVINVSQF
jgi:hypothetical protein